MAKKPTKKLKPLTISIHGNGIDIDAAFDSAGKPKSGASQLDKVIQQLVESFTVKMTPQVPTVAPEHDFDIVQSVIKHGTPTVLQAIIDLATAQLEQRRAAS